MQKSWMWQSNDGVSVEGAIVDIEENRVQWFDAIGCACGDSSMVQTLQDFNDRGLRFLIPPDDVLAEMRTFIQETQVTA